MKTETIEEFLKRGGKIKRVENYKEYVHPFNNRGKDYDKKPPTKPITNPSTTDLTQKTNC